MQPTLADKFLEAIEDPDLLSLVRLVAVLDAHLVEALGSMGDLRANWEGVIAAHQRMLEAQHHKDTKLLAVALTDLSAATHHDGNTISSGNSCMTLRFESNQASPSK
jgi:hypothetical protein